MIFWIRALPSPFRGGRPDGKDRGYHEKAHIRSVQRSSCLSVQERVDEMVSFANECNRGIDMEKITGESWLTIISPTPYILK